MLSKKTFPYSLASIIILLYILIRAAFFLANWEKSFILTWDVFGYYLYLPALFIYNDLGDLSFVSEILHTHYNDASFYYAATLPEGGMVLKYPAGMALLYSPFFFIGHICAHLFGYPADGFSLPYQAAIAMGSIVFVALGLLVLRNVLRKYFSDLTVAACLLILVLATNLFNYTAYDGPMPHAWLFTVYALVLWVTEKWHAHPQRWTAAVLGLLIGLAAIMRPINVLIFLVPLLWGVSSRAKLKEKVQLLLKNWPHLVILGLCTIAVGSIQLIYWKVYSGDFLFYSYEDQGFQFLNPFITDGLFSYRKGWLMYTPVMILALIGFWPLYKKNKSAFVPILAMTVIHAYIVFSWEIWWYGGAFGQRPMVDIYALLAFPMAALIEVASKKRVIAVATFIFAFLCADLNLMMTWQAHAPGGGMHTEATTGAYYWKIFGTTRAKKADRLYIDVKDELKDLDGYELTELYFNDMEADSLPGAVRNITKNGEQTFLVDHEITHSPKFEINMSELGATQKDWIRVSAWVFFKEITWDGWKQARLISSIRTPEKEIGRIEPRLHWLTAPWNWHFVEYEFRMKDKYLNPDTKLEVYVWRDHAEIAIWIDDLKVDIIRKK